MPPEEGEDKGSFFQRNKMYVIIGGALVVIIIVALLLSGRNPSTGPKLTLASLNRTVAANLLWTQGKFASQAELIANKANKTDIPNVSGITTRLDVEETKSTNQATAITDIQATLTTLQTEIDGFDSFNITAINSTVQELKTQIDNWSFNDVSVNVTDSGVEVTTFTAGDYPIFLNLYGENLIGVSSHPSTLNLETYGQNATMTVILEPKTAWVKDNVITLGIDGDVAYASVGGS